jgi:hypothetical protein
VSLLVVPKWDPEEPWPTLGPVLCDFIEDRGIYGPGSLQGLDYVIDDDFRAFLHGLYEVFPKGHPQEGRRRHKRGGLSVRKGLAKTEKGALIVLAELHPEGPVRFDGWDANGNPVGRPVMAPYIPMLAVTVEQVEELGYGALKYIIEEGPDADLFDCTLERIVRLGERGREDGKAVPLANSPGARDGARTTLNFFDEPHRLYLPRQKQAHTTMDANLPKRPLEDPWSLYVGTAGEPGQDSVAEDLHKDAVAINEGRNTDPRLFYVCRWAGQENPETGEAYNLEVKAERIAAIAEATGPIGEFGPGQFEDIAEKWDREGADKGFLERVWLNRWTKSDEQAFDSPRWAKLKHIGGDVKADLRPRIPNGARVAAGFDGARRKDSTAIVITELATGTQELWAIWERDVDDPDWEVDEAEVQAAFDELFRVMDVWKFYADPPYWTDTVGKWAGAHPDKVEEWWCNRYRLVAQKVRAYREAIGSGSVGWSEAHKHSETLGTHIAAAGRLVLSGVYDDDDEPLFILKKIHQDRKFDAAMAAVLSWTCYLDAVKAGANVQHQPSRPRRLR